METLYPEYSILFMFNNVTNYLIYSKDTLYIYKMNKQFGDK